MSKRRMMNGGGHMARRSEARGWLSMCSLCSKHQLRASVPWRSTRSSGAAAVVLGLQRTSYTMHAKVTRTSLYL